MGGRASAQSPIVPDVVGQIVHLNARGDFLGFHMGDAPPPSIAMHWQGIARHPDPHAHVLYLSRKGACSPDGAKVVAVDVTTADLKDGPRLRSNRLRAGVDVPLSPPWNSDKVVWNHDFADYNHAGGLQAVGHYLAVPLESPCDNASNGRVDFFDISDPRNPQLAHSFEVNHSMGMVGLTQLPDGHYFMAATWATDGEVEFYRTSGDDITSMHWIDDWSPSELLSGEWAHGDGSADYYFQALQLVQGDNGKLYLIGLRNNSGSPGSTEEDVVYVYEVTLNGFQVSMSEVYHRDLESTPLSNGSGFRQCNFSAAAGVYVSPDGELLIYGAMHDASGPELTTNVAEFRSKGGSLYSNPCLANVELYSNADFDGYNLSINALDYLQEDYANFSRFDGADGFNNRASSVRFNLPSGCTCTLWEDKNFSGRRKELQGNGSVQEISNLANVSWTGDSGTVNGISSVSFSAGCPTALTYGGPIPAAALATVPGGPCAMLKLFAGNYPGAVTLNRPIELRGMAGEVIIGE
jgi:hypothetical protein